MTTDEKIKSLSEEQDVQGAQLDEQPEKNAQEQVPSQDSYKDQFMRVNADFSNYKRRMEKERLVWNHAGQTVVLNALLPVIDDLERAILTGASVEGNEQDNAWFQGLLLVHKNIGKQLEQLGVEKIDCTTEFNPELHEALMQVDSTEHKSGQIVDVVRQGYTLKGEVLRHAQVSVAK